MRPSTRLVVLGRKQLWTPAALGSSLALWLDADDFSTITLNGSTVSQWRDKSGNARHASQSQLWRQPTYTADGFNGKPVLTFDGTNDNLSIASTALFSSGNADLSIFCVYNSIASSSYGAIFANYPEGNLELLDSTSLGYAVPWGLWNDGDLDLANGVYVQNKKSIIGLIRNSGVFTGYTDGTTNLSVSNSQSVYTESNTQSQWYIGSNSINSENGNVDIAEVICVNSALSTTDRQYLKGYLAWKWVLIANLPSSHPFKFTPPIA